MSLENKLDQINTREQSSIKERFYEGIKNWAIDTSAKVACYAPIMAGMEMYNGLDGEQILKSRASAALIDVVAARIYTKAADYLSKKCKVDLKNGGVKGWALDTVAMVGVYTPIYAGILTVAGADAKQIIYSLTMGAVIAAGTSKPFRKYALMPWRNLCNYKR